MPKIGESGEILFLLLKSIKDEVFKNKDLGKGEVKEVFNNLSIDMQAFDLNFFRNCRFISGPTIPTVHIRPWKSFIAIASCFVSFFLFVIFTFVSHWWQSNKTAIMSDPSLMDLSHITGNTVIGNDVFISTMVASANDNKMGRAGYDDNHINGPTVESGAIIGAGSTLLPGVRIGKDATVAAGALDNAIRT